MINPNLLRITSTRALIDIKTTRGKLDIRQPKAEVNMHTEHAKVEISTKKPRVEIDQSQCFADAGLKGYMELTRTFVQYAKQTATENIGRIARQGDEMAAIENGQDMIPIHALENAYEQFQHEFDYDYIPKHRPRIELIEGTVDIKVRGGRVDLDVKVNKPIINYTRGKVETYLKQKNRIDIEYLGKAIDRTI